MINIQHAINFHMPVRVSGIDHANITKIEFLFKRSITSNAVTAKSAVWKNDGTGTAVTGQDAQGNPIILIPWTRDETFTFPAGQTFYMHARVHLAGTNDEPFVPIVPLTMGPSLFSTEEVEA